MLDLLCRKSNCGDLEVNLAMRHLASHEWGRARMTLERALAKGRLSEPETARTLLQEVCDRLGVMGAKKL
ncbi:MAG: hypothetical protein KDI34_05415 [Halioglobus sp.]|nr:hypothetical protein [Halioglobus sp.]